MAVDTFKPICCCWVKRDERATTVQNESHGRITGQHLRGVLGDREEIGKVEVMVVA